MNERAASPGNGREEFFLTRPMPMVLRLLLGAAGLFAIVAPVRELWRAFIPPNWLSLFFGFIILGAWSVGGMFLLASILGEDQRWRVRDGAIEIRRRSALRQCTIVARPDDVCGTTIEESLWDSGPNTFRVALRLRNGDVYETPDFEKRENAVALEARLRAMLHLD